MKFSFKQVMGASALAGVLCTFTLGSALAQSATMEMNPQNSDNAQATQMMVDDDIVVFGDLQLSGAFTRAMPPRAVTGGGFLTIVNNGDQDDRLVSITSSVTEHVELHIMSMDGEVMKMQSQPDGFIIPAGETTELKPGGKHIMFINVETPFTKGDDVKVTLHFERAGDVEMTLRVLEIGAKGMMPMGMDHSNMGGSMQSGSD
ncbi:MAG: copper chaperone PCu(A)C [Devosiaceae bacterium]|nr:copper chaperone PCu(A)C [Devosiaceae bacterium]